MTLSDRQQALCLVSLLYESEETSALLSFFPAQSSALTAYAGQWLGEPPELRRNRLLKRLKKMKQPKVASELAAFHPDWIGKALAGETPGVRRVLSRLLPPQRESALPGKDQNRAVSLTAAHAGKEIDPEVLQVVEAHFFHRLIGGHTAVAAVWEPLLRLPASAWESVFKSVAYEELAVAFYRLKKSAYMAVVNRLLLADAKEIQARMTRLETLGSTIDPRQEERARLHLVSLDTGRISAPELPIVLGLYLLSKACCGDDEARACARIAYRLPLKRGKLLLSLIKRHRAINTQASVVSYQKRFLKAAQGILASEP